MIIKKVVLRRTKNSVFYPGDLLFYKRRNCEVTILGVDTVFGGYRVIFHDYETVGNLPHDFIKYLYNICN